MFSMNKFRPMVALGAALFLWGCDAMQEPIEPRLSPGGMVVMSTTGETYVVAHETDPQAGSISAEIGAAGGELVLGDHKLVVSAGAVDSATTFKMQRDPEYPIRVHLTASRDSENDVGQAGFGAPVTVTVSYDAAAEKPADESEITLMYFRPDGLVETLTTTVDVDGNKVSAALPHFSLFGLGWP